MQGGAPGTHPQDGCRREAYLRVRRSAARARQSAYGGQMGLFQQPARVYHKPVPNISKPDVRAIVRNLLQEAIR